MAAADVFPARVAHRPWRVPAALLVVLSRLSLPVLLALVALATDPPIDLPLLLQLLVILVALPALLAHAMRRPADLELGAGALVLRRPGFVGRLPYRAIARLGCGRRHSVSRDRAPGAVGIAAARARPDRVATLRGAPALRDRDRRSGPAVDAVGAARRRLGARRHVAAERRLCPRGRGDPALALVPLRVEVHRVFAGARRGVLQRAPAHRLRRNVGRILPVRRRRVRPHLRAVLADDGDLSRAVRRPVARRRGNCRVADCVDQLIARHDRAPRRRTCLPAPVLRRRARVSRRAILDLSRQFHPSPPPPAATARPPPPARDLAATHTRPL